MSYTVVFTYVPTGDEVRLDFTVPLLDRDAVDAVAVAAATGLRAVPARFADVRVVTTKEVEVVF